MSYSQDTKAELCNAKLNCKHCQKAMLYGMLLMCKGVNSQAISVYTESKQVCDFLSFGIVEYTASIVTVVTPDIRVRNKRPLYTINVEDRTDIENIIECFFKDGQANKQHINDDLFFNECCAIAFLRGVFCICGTIINPQKEYHLEFCTSNKTICEELIYILSSFDLDFKMTTRGKNYIAYIKESQQIEDTLTCLGASKASIGLMNLKIEKELRNKVNRRTNCETANIEKTVNASYTQIQKIKLIQEKNEFDNLPIELKEVALLRLENPDSSLSELCKLANNNISRSGLNHRLKRLCNYADELL